MSEDIEKTRYIEKRRAEINNYENLLRAILALKKHFEQDKKNKFYFGGKIVNKDKEKYQNYTGDTPDIIIQTNKRALLGEAKKSLPNPKESRSKKQYIKKILEENIIEQLKKYDQNFENLVPKEHDIFLLVPEHENEAIGMLKFDYLEKKKPFKNKFFLLVYNIGLLANTKSIMVKLDYGECSDKVLLDKLRRAIRYNEKDLANELGKFKIFEENEDATPVEYVMSLLWTSIFPELVKANDKEQILERYARQENKFTVKLTKMMSYLTDLYSLPTFKSGKDHSNDRTQFKTKLVKNAMNRLITLGLAREIPIQGPDVSYEIYHKPLHKKDELEYFIESGYEKGNERKEFNVTGIKKLNSFFDETK